MLVVTKKREILHITNEPASIKELYAYVLQYQYASVSNYSQDIRLIT